MTHKEARYLWAVVLGRAVQDLNVDPKQFGHDRKKEQKAKLVRWQTHGWFQSNSHAIGSLCWICEQLDLDVDWVRRKVNERRAETRQALADGTAAPPQ